MHGEVHVETFSTLHGIWETDEDSDFYLEHEPRGAFSAIEQINTTSSAGEASVLWEELEADTAYQWYATVETCHYARDSEVWGFVTR